ncbi:unnamed protein product [Strongylus vulgaris]|uniref:G-protein coupled receptors family 1 profile domain-containing protein n=1 Tax=Strongylus vulgaris TaxID=40348 RepID=A0A3P7I220_STRVU|nr:unnamed protein product [Strongylus vulgaris]
MSVEVAIYILNALLYSIVILLDVLVMWAAVKTRETSRNFIFHILFTAMILDVAVHFVTIFHDVPSYFLNQDFSTVGTTYVYVLILCLQWFAQLLFLPLLSIIHFLAIFSPAKFRKASHRHFACANAVVILLALILTAPHFTKYSGYTYLLPGHFWYFDFAKPYSYIYQHLNVTLQIICVVFVVVADTLIIWKICSLRKKHKITLPKRDGTQKKHQVVKEVRLALNFLVLSVCFLIMTIFYNVNFG